MGYRSHVIIVLPDEYVAKYFELLTENDFTLKTDYVGELPDYPAYQVISYEDLKWYQGYKDVETITAWLGNLNKTLKIVNSTKENQLLLVRLGENYDDYEEIIGDANVYNIYPSVTLEGFM